MAVYTPEPPPITVEAELQEYLMRELGRVGDSIRFAEEIILSNTNVAPTKPEEGTILYADGVNFNPGSGEGFYGYINGAWVKIGLLPTDDLIIDDLTMDDLTVDLITASGLFTLNSGQIVFPATAIPSADANTLDDYEITTWTPTYAMSGVNFSSITYSVQDGYCIKIGDLVFVTGRIVVATLTKGAASGQLQINGLPFSATFQSAVTVGYTVGFLVESPISGLTSGTSIFLYKKTVGTGHTAIAIADMTAGAGNETRFTAVYHV